VFCKSLWFAIIRGFVECDVADGEFILGADILLLRMWIHGMRVLYYGF
jgi:hypothetical protein